MTTGLSHTDAPQAATLAASTEGRPTTDLVKRSLTVLLARADRILHLRRSNPAASPPVSTFVRLPQELHDAISVWIRGRSDKISLMLCCQRSFEAYAAAIYRCVHIPQNATHAQVKSLLDGLQHRAWLAAHVRHFRVEWRSMWKETVLRRVAMIRSLQRVLPLLTSLRTIELPLVLVMRLRGLPVTSDALRRICFTRRMREQSWFAARTENFDWEQHDGQHAAVWAGSALSRAVATLRPKQFAHCCLHDGRLTHKHMVDCLGSFLSVSGNTVTRLVLHETVLAALAARRRASPIVEEYPAISTLEVDMYRHDDIDGLVNVTTFFKPEWFNIFPNITALVCRHPAPDTDESDRTNLKKVIPTKLEELSASRLLLQTFIDPWSCVWTKGRDGKWKENTEAGLQRLWYEVPDEA